MAREEYNLPLTQEAYEHLKPKADGLVISKTRYLIPEKDGLTIELDVFMMITRTAARRGRIPIRGCSQRLHRSGMVRP